MSSHTPPATDSPKKAAALRFALIMVVVLPLTAICFSAAFAVLIVAVEPIGYGEAFWVALHEFCLTPPLIPRGDDDVLLANPAAKVNARARARFKHDAIASLRPSVVSGPRAPPTTELRPVFIGVIRSLLSRRDAAADRRRRTVSRPSAAAAAMPIA